MRMAEEPEAEYFWRVKKSWEDKEDAAFGGNRARG